MLIRKRPPEKKMTTETATTTNNIEDHELPKTILTRLLKQSLPEGTLIQKDAKIAISKSTLVFVNYVTFLANEIAKQAGLKTLTPEHVYKALEMAELESF